MPNPLNKSYDRRAGTKTKKTPREPKDDVSRVDFSDPFISRGGGQEGVPLFTIMYSVSIKMSLAVKSLNGSIHTF